MFGLLVQQHHAAGADLEQHEDAVIDDRFKDVDLGLEDLPGAMQRGFASMASRPAQSVPTSVAMGPDGHYYVGEPRGFPAPADESSIWRVAPGADRAACGESDDCIKVFDGGFTSIIDVVFGPDGRLYVAELDELSWAAVEFFGGGVGGAVNACDLDTMACEGIASGIPMLTAMAFDGDGNLHVTENSLIPGLVSVVEVP